MSGEMLGCKVVPAIGREGCTARHRSKRGLRARETAQGEVKVAQVGRTTRYAWCGTSGKGTGQLVGGTGRATSGRVHRGWRRWEFLVLERDDGRRCSRCPGSDLALQDSVLQSMQVDLL